MVRFGYTLICEQRSPRRLVEDARRAQEAGFDFLAISDHIHPWLETQGESPFAWGVLGALTEATDLPLMTMVTCPTMRYHPAVVAQMAATTSLLASAGFEIGVGAGENLNEHVVGGDWPAVTVRHEMLAEAIAVLRGLWTGEYVSFHGDYFTVEDARIFSLPERPLRIHMAAGGREAARLAGALADGLIVNAPDSELINAFRDTGGEGKPCFGQVAVCHGEDESRSQRLARELWRFAVPGWKVMAELPNPVNFEAATTTVRPEDVGRLVACGPRPERHIEAIRQMIEAGCDHVALVQVGPEQEGFLHFWREELRPRLTGQEVA